MRVGYTLEYDQPVDGIIDRALRLVEAGVDDLWVPEAYGFDAVSMLGFLAARTDHVRLGSSILNVFSRTPTTIAQVAAGLDAVCGGRFVLGLGASGPQVIEGWHGVPYHRPLTRTRETIAVVRRAMRREVIEFHGEEITLPLPPHRGTGLGKPLKMLTRPVRDQVPIFLAALGPASVRLAATEADGWFPLFFQPERAQEVWGAPLGGGRAARSSDLAPLEVVAGGRLAFVEDDMERQRALDAEKPKYALYMGGMGARGRNFYNDLVASYGFGDAAREIQDHYLAGRKGEAIALVPDELVAATSLIGTPNEVRERVQAFADAGVTGLNVSPRAGAEADVTRLREILG
ncbi:LLM class F420-dependent oxidoreductase [Nitriliruptor alkaliphilus]|uniref:LLM class F420-dependent oxidoreductase n=1 Tax=Nitriliruptor alkaliphilus TaxID=427918 RepID=UPI0006960B98